MIFMSGSGAFCTSTYYKDKSSYSSGDRLDLISNKNEFIEYKILSFVENNLNTQEEFVQKIIFSGDVSSSNPFIIKAFCSLNKKTELNLSNYKDNCLIAFMNNSEYFFYIPQPTKQTIEYISYLCDVSFIINNNKPTSLKKPFFNTFKKYQYKRYMNKLKELSY